MTKFIRYILMVTMLIQCFALNAFASSQDIPTTGGIETIQPNGEIPSTEQEPLTPEGNATLVDDYYGDKQLITITTKSGNYFYILIDRANEDKETAVHFLNQVDESDLMALMDDNEQDTPQTCSCDDKCKLGLVNTDCEVCSTDMTKCTGKEPVIIETPEKTESKEQQDSINLVAIAITVLILAGAGVFAYMRFIKNKPDTAGKDDLEDYDYGEDENSDDDELPWENEDDENTDEEDSAE